MPDQNKRQINFISTRPIKRNNNIDLSSDINEQEPQWVELGNNKKSWVWEHFGIKTDGRAYCRYKVLRNGTEVECNYSCMHNNQTSTQQNHLNSVHKVFEKEKLVRQNQ